MNHRFLFAALAVMTACTPEVSIIFNEGEADPSSGIVVNDLFICNAPKGTDWELWGHFYELFELPSYTTEASGAELHHYNGSCWRVTPTAASDTVLLQYTDFRKKHSWAPKGFFIRLNGSGKVIPVKEVQMIFQPSEPLPASGYTKTDLAVTDIIPSVKSIELIGDGESLIEKVECKMVPDIRPQGYRLDISSGKAVISASDSAGLRYGRVTLDLFRENAAGAPLHDMTVEDWPDFAYRGQMLDAARLFFPIGELEKMVLALERSKMNVLVLHLTDDEGWRLEIKDIPELTSFGAFHAIPTRREDGTYFSEKGLHPVKVCSLGPSFSGPSGYYRREEFISFIRFAFKHGVTVIPDFDFPGHCLAAIESMEARERNTGDTSFRLVDPADSSAYCAINGFHDNVIDLALPSVFHFIGTVFDEVISIYREAGVPLEQIMIGGDEVADGAWTGSPSCKEAMELNGFTSLHQLRSLFLAKLVSMLKERGVKTSGYEEIGFNLSDEAFEALAANCGCLNIWAPLDKDNAYKSYDFANRGLPVLMSPGSHTYCDNTYSMAWEEGSVFWAGILDERKAFSMLPFRLNRSNRFDRYNQPIDMTAIDPYIPELKRPENIIGVQSMLWCDGFYDTREAFSYLFPKTYGIYERSWNAQPSWQDSTDPLDPVFVADFNRFYSIVAEREIPYLDAAGLPHRSAMTSDK